MRLPSPLKTETQALVTVGQLKAPFGVRGWIKLISYTQPEENILVYRPWYIEQPGAGWIPLETATVNRHGSGFVVQLSGVNDRDQAAALGGRKIAVSRDCLPPVTEGEYYWSDLIGLEVFNQRGERLGRVKNMMETGANDVLVVCAKDSEQRNESKEILIPFVTAVVTEVDLDRGRLRVDWTVDY